MPTKTVVGRALYSGQGMCSTVEIYDDKDKLTYLMLLDFGAEKDTATVRMATLPRLVKMVTDHGRIDAMVISHSDADHWKLMNELLEELPSGIPILRAAIGLGYWVKTAATFKSKVEARLPSGQSIDALPDGKTNIKVKLDAWFTVDDVTFSILAGSVVMSDAIKDATSEIESNTASLVIHVAYKNIYQVFTGDATWVTLRFMNNKLADRTLAGTGFMLTAPHHGAIATSVDNEGTLTDLIKFTKAVHPQTTLSSAQLRRRFNHPNACAVATISANVGKNAYPSGGGNHDCVLNFYHTDLCSANAIFKQLVSERTGAYDEEWFQVSTPYNIFTNLEALYSVANWYFTINQDGTTLVTRSDVAAPVTEEFRRMLTLRPSDELEFFVGAPPPETRAAPRPAATVHVPAPPGPWRYFDDIL
jgi:beta-lactamase superfamily II metal-dependent hydrolase